MRRPLLVFLLAVLAMFTTAALVTPAGADPSGPVRMLTVLSFNIHHGVGPDGRLDLDRLAEEIRRSRADVVGLQEVDRHFGARSDWADQPGELAARLGMHLAYGANLDLEPPAPGSPRRQYGTAVLSRHPITSWHNTLLPKARPADEQRGLLAVVLNVRGVAVRVLNTHLQHDNADSRLLQAKVIADAASAAAEPIVLTGDLNATPEAPEITTLTSLLTDSHAAAGHGDGFTYPVEAPTKRIDYVLTDRAFPVWSRVLATASSDHRPVLARVIAALEPAGQAA